MDRGFTRRTLANRWVFPVNLATAWPIYHDLKTSCTMQSELARERPWGQGTVEIPVLELNPLRGPGNQFETVVAAQIGEVLTTDVFLGPGQDSLRLSEGGSQSMFGMLQHGKQGRFSMAAAGQLRADFLGDDLPRTVRKSEEADQTRQLLALPVIRDGCCASRPAARRPW